jgi:hypothetical protein
VDPARLLQEVARLTAAARSASRSVAP